MKIDVVIFVDGASGSDVAVVISRLVYWGARVVLADNAESANLVVVTSKIDCLCDDKGYLIVCDNPLDMIATIARIARVDLEKEAGEKDHDFIDRYRVKLPRNAEVFYTRTAFPDLPKFLDRLVMHLDPVVIENVQAPTATADVGR